MPVKARQRTNAPTDWITFEEETFSIKQMMQMLRALMNLKCPTMSLGHDEPQ